MTVNYRNLTQVCQEKELVRSQRDIKTQSQPTNTDRTTPAIGDLRLDELDARAREARMEMRYRTGASARARNRQSESGLSLWRRACS